MSFLKGCRIAALVLWMCKPAVSHAAGPVPNFQLEDVNPRSARFGEQVSPRDYQLQLSAFYFVAARCVFCRSQYTHLESILNEVTATNPGLRVEVLAINRISDEPFNPEAAPSFNSLPWLQDTTNQLVWARWSAEWRDVWVLDSFNRLILRDNLTQHDLNVATNRVALKNVLLQASAAVDSDKDGLLDDWEYGWFGSLEALPDIDDDGDGFDNRTEFAFASSPIDAASRPALIPYVRDEGGVRIPGVRFRRFSGSAARWILEVSTNLGTWSADSSRFVRVATRNLHDAAGGAEDRYELSSPTTDPAVFFRVGVPLGLGE